jgi:hypothetical protein
MYMSFFYKNTPSEMNYCSRGFAFRVFRMLQQNTNTTHGLQIRASEYN